MVSTKCLETETLDYLSIREVSHLDFWIADVFLASPCFFRLHEHMGEHCVVLFMSPHERAYDNK